MDGVDPGSVVHRPRRCLAEVDRSRLRHIGAGFAAGSSSHYTARQCKPPTFDTSRMANSARGTSVHRWSCTNDVSRRLLTGAPLQAASLPGGCCKTRSRWIAGKTPGGSGVPHSRAERREFPTLPSERMLMDSLDGSERGWEVNSRAGCRSHPTLPTAATAAA